MKEIYLFEYVHEDCLLGRFNPTVKMAALAGICISAGLIPAIPLAVLFVLILALLPAAGRAARLQLRGIWKLYIFFAVSGLIKGFTADSAVSGVVFPVRMLTMMIAGVLFYSTTRIHRLRHRTSVKNSNSISNMLTNLLELVLMTAAFLPLIFKTMHNLKNARDSRCFAAGGISIKSVLRSVKLLSVPLMITMFVKTDQMADAWYSRCFGIR